MSLVKKITIIATSILLIVALVVGVYFLAKNWSNIQSGITDGTTLYTQEDLDQAYKDGYTEGSEGKDSLQSQIEDLLNKNEQLTEDNSKITATNTELADKVTNLEISNSNALSEVDRLTALNDNLKEDLTQATSDLTLKEAELLKLQEDKSKLQEELNNSTIENDELEYQVATLNANIKTLQEDIAVKMTQIESLEAQINEIEKTISEYESAVRSGNNSLLIDSKKFLSDNEVFIILNDGIKNYRYFIVDNTTTIGELFPYTYSTWSQTPTMGWNPETGEVTYYSYTDYILSNPKNFAGTPLSNDYILNVSSVIYVDVVATLVTINSYEIFGTQPFNSDELTATSVGQSGGFANRFGNEYSVKTFALMCSTTFSNSVTIILTDNSTVTYSVPYTVIEINDYDKYCSTEYTISDLNINGQVVDLKIYIEDSKLKYQFIGELDYTQVADIKINVYFH